MKKQLFLAAFKKAEKQSGNNTKHGLSTYLEKVFIDDLKFPVSKITFVRYYEKYVKDDDNINYNPSSDLLNKISEYVDYNNYEDFVSKNDFEKEKSLIRTVVKSGSSSKEDIEYNRLSTFFKKHKITLIAFVILLVGFVVFQSISRQRWMVWDEDHYIEVKFDAKKYEIGKLKLYSEDRINHFRKITPDCDTDFFNSNGEVKIWYGKNSKKELEYFTDLGLHPETGKTLDPITVYMIRKHICKEY